MMVAATTALTRRRIRSFSGSATRSGGRRFGEEYTSSGLHFRTLSISSNVSATHLGRPNLRRAELKAPTIALPRCRPCFVIPFLRFVSWVYSVLARYGVLRERPQIV